MHRSLLRNLWLLTIAAVIVLSLLPRATSTVRFLDSLPLGDKFQHLAAYLPLALFPSLYQPRNQALISILAMAALGVGLEFFQLLSPGRSFDTHDMLADFAGLALGALLAALLKTLPLRQRL